MMRAFYTPSGTAGITGRVVSDLIGDFDPPLDIEPLRPARFDGSGPRRLI
jgi:glycine/D-amino acid oxidase-like deaminating enzyme